MDRGLFQLNSQTFAHLAEDDFFNPEINSFHGLKYLEFCLQAGDMKLQGKLTSDDGQALAIYNAGYTRAMRGTIPPSTASYVRRVLDYRDALIEEFTAFMLSHFPPA